MAVSKKKVSKKVTSKKDDQPVKRAQIRKNGKITKDTKSYYSKDFERFLNYYEEKKGDTRLNKKDSETLFLKYMKDMAKRCQVSTLKRQSSAIRNGFKIKKINSDFQKVSEFISKEVKKAA